MVSSSGVWFPRHEAGAGRYHKITYSSEALDALLVGIFLEAHTQPPREIVLGLDATGTPLHGEQEARFFHGYYGYYCYLPLYIFCGGHLLCARLRAANQDASAGRVGEAGRMVRQIRGQWPRVRIILRADSGFCHEELMAWCEKHDVEYVFGLARNDRLRCKIARALRHKPSKNTDAREKRRACSPSSAIAHARAGRAHAAWWAKRNIWKRARTHASWLLPWRRRLGRRRSFTNGSTARGASDAKVRAPFDALGLMRRVQTLERPRHP